MFYFPTMFFVSYFYIFEDVGIMQLIMLQYVRIKVYDESKYEIRMW